MYKALRTRSTSRETTSRAANGHRQLSAYYRQAKVSELPPLFRDDESGSNDRIVYVEQRSLKLFLGPAFIFLDLSTNTQEYDAFETKAIDVPFAVIQPSIQHPSLP